VVEAAAELLLTDEDIAEIEGSEQEETELVAAARMEL